MVSFFFYLAKAGSDPWGFYLDTKLVPTFVCKPMKLVASVLRRFDVEFC